MGPGHRGGGGGQGVSLLALLEGLVFDWRGTLTWEEGMDASETA